MSEIEKLLFKSGAGTLSGPIEHCITITHDAGYIATSEYAARELAKLRSRIAELEADVMADLVEAPTNERIMKDVYDENERLKAAFASAELVIDYVITCDENDQDCDHQRLYDWMNNYCRVETGDKE